MNPLNIWSSVLALAVGTAATVIMGVAPKVAAEEGDFVAFIMAAVFLSVLLWLPVRAVVGVVAKAGKNPCD